MSKIILLTTLLFVCIVNCSAQDVVIFKDGKEVAVKILEVSKDEVRYKNWEQPDGPDVHVLKSSLRSLHYYKGQTIRFDHGSPDPVMRSIDDVQEGHDSDPNGIDNPPPTKPKEAFVYVSVMPRPPYDLLEYINKNIRYPEEAKKKGVKGKVLMKFIVTETGEIENVQVARGIGSGCDEEATRVIKGMPKWTPGKNEGKPVRVWFTQPISFVL